eukprot:Phypoly_transcript_07437.p1 GENE.Phypoly_transcript_07437~~Phypoly_transcript_07437.p1  ORF type:complete len:545 (+),score=85.23 Phypoly_transcript_07437:27-1637(+)
MGTGLSHMSAWTRTLLIITIFLFLLECTNALHVFDAYRMIHIESPTAGKIGSQKSLLNLLASAPSLSLNTSLARTIAVVPLESLTLNAFRDIVFTRGAEGLLVLLPENTDSLSQETIAAWGELERELLRMEVPIPVYFAPFDTHLQGVYDYVLNHGEASAGDKYQLVASTDVSAVKDASIINYQGWLAGSPATAEEGGRKPTLAVVAYYDSFGIAPGMATGVDSNGSGVVGVLELARIFSKLYADVKTKGRYNIVFVLTSAGSLNYLGTAKWLDERSNAGALDNVEFALCLDSLAGPNLYLHVSRPPKDPATQKIYDSFTNTATKMNIPFEIVHKKINIAQPEVYWEHEQFSRKRVVAGTLSHKSAPSGPLSRAGLLDKKVNIQQVARNIRFAGEALASYIYGLEGAILLHEDGSYAVVPERVAAWSEAFASHPRVSPFLPSTSPVLSQLEQELKQFTTDVAKETYPLEGDYKYFNPISTSLTAYRAKPYTFDLYLSIAITIYLVGLFAYLKGDAFIPTVKEILNLGKAPKTIKRL